MRVDSFSLFVAVCAIGATAVAQPDRIRTLTGTETGEILSTSRDAVTIERDGEEVEIPIDEIRRVMFGGEPSTLLQARINFESGGYQNAAEQLDRIELREIDNPLVLQDFEFYRAASATRLAIAGRGDMATAGRALRTFLRTRGDSHHYYEAVEVMGDLLLAIGRPEQAVTTYGRLANAESAGLRARAGLLAGAALQAEGDHAEAIERFDAALAIRNDSPAAAEQKTAARLGKAASLAATGRGERALEIVREVIRTTSDDDEATLAAAYNALGRCHAEAGRTTDALLAYLHTDLLFPGDTPTHAEALFHLTDLWEQLGKPDDADDAAAKLRRRYAASVWLSRLEQQR